MASKAFAETGYDDTSFNALLAKLKLSKSQAYYYFEDKADLFVTAAAACYEDYYAEVRGLKAPESAREFWDYVLELTRVGLRFQRSHPVAAGLAQALAKSSVRKELSRSSLVNAPSSAARHAEWIRAGQSLGAVRQDLDLDLLVSLSMSVSAELDAWFAPHAAEATERELERTAKSFTDIVRRLFETAAPRAAEPRKRRKGSRKLEE